MNQLKNIAIYVNPNHDENGDFTRKTIEKLKKHKPSISALEPMRDLIGEDISIIWKKDLESLLKNADILIMLGGDGTMIDMSCEAAKTGVPVLGINLGHLGFLTTIEKNEIELLDVVFDGNYIIDERMMLEVSIGEGKKLNALNETAFFSSTNSKIAEFSLSCDGHHVIDLKSDGLIVATPTGSTAYSLSAGGPIIDPSTELFCATPVCPHTLGSRPIIFSARSTLGVKGHTNDRATGIIVTCDGRSRTYVDDESEITVMKSMHKLKTVKIGETRFFDIVNTKLYNR